MYTSTITKSHADAMSKWQKEQQCQHPHIHICTHTDAHTHTHTCTHTYAHTHIHTHVRTHTHIHTCTHTDAHTHIHTCTHTYAHTHTRTRTRTIHEFSHIKWYPYVRDRPSGHLYYYSVLKKTWLDLVRKQSTCAKL
jgi:hypothetical protein